MSVFGKLEKRIRFAVEEILVGKNTEASACIGGEKAMPCGFNVFVLGENDKVEGVI